MEPFKENLSKKQPIPIGVDDFKDLIKENYLHIDKTLLIKEFWDDKAKVTLITRPRRFGKSISLSMLRYFFEKTEPSHAYLFEKSTIWQYEEFQKLQGTYPVIFISFKDVKCETWEEALQELKDLLTAEINRIITPVAHLLTPYLKQQYDKLITQTANNAEFTSSLKLSMEILKKYYDQNTVVLIDEYDTPITHAYVHQYYDKMIEFMRNLLSKALKGNECLCRGLMTGVVRTAKDGIMSGLNNPDIYTVLDAPFSDKFGFTECETNLLLKSVGSLDKKEELKSWYNGYVVGTKHSLPTKIYNPWSVLKYIKNSCIPETYWANTGSTELLERLIAEADETTQRDLKLLMEAGSLENKEINQDVILLDLDKKRQEPWSFLLFAGYITATHHSFQDNKHYYTLAIPNEEIATLYNKLIVSAINKTFSSDKLRELLDALITGNLHPVNTLLSEFVNSMCSSHDLPQNDLERSLHLFVLGLLASLSERYVIKSNLESGRGRYDILMHPKRANDPAIVIEFKKGKDYELEELADEALCQIKDNKYESQLKDFGYRGKVLCYGIATFKKQLVAKMDAIHLS